MSEATVKPSRMHAAQLHWERMIKLHGPVLVASIGVHALAIVIAMLFILPEIQRKKPMKVETELAEVLEDIKLDEPDLEPLPLIQQQPMETLVSTEVTPSMLNAHSETSTSTQPATLSNVDLPDTNSITKMLEGTGAMSTASKGLGSSLESRSGKVKEALLQSGGGTKASERSVNAGLIWLIRHQMPEGNWSIQYRSDASFPGTVKSDVGATGLALLPLLAANHTPKAGEHRAAVAKGLNWLINKQKGAKDKYPGLYQAAGDQQPMYSHSLGTIAMCEAFGLTKDKRLGVSAQAALNFIMKTQNKKNGWRYSPETEDVDTSVFGWNMMALKSGKMAGLDVPDEVFVKCDKYLDTCAHGDKKGLYSYNPVGSKESSGPRPSITALGLLCRQYRGVKRSNPMIKEGVEYLLQHAPGSKDGGKADVYYWYYGTQVIHNYQGPEWDRWNRSIRKFWVDTQVADQKSKDFGSWDPAKVANEKTHDIAAGGRLYVTSLGLLQLTVYYRYLPVYKVLEEEEGSSSAGG